MTAIYAGDDGSSLVLAAGYPTKKRDASGYWRIAYRYWCKASAAESLIPAAGASCPLSGHTGLKCDGVDITPYPGAPARCWVDVSYGPSDSATPITRHASGDTVKELSAGGFKEVSLDDPQILTMLTAAQVAERKAAGYKTVTLPTVEYHYTTYADTFTWSEANCAANIGATSDPTGMTSPTAGAWMLTAYNVRQEGALIQVSKTWTYSSLGWTTATAT